LTAGSPIFKGKLADIDTRWKVIQDSVDCRTEEERDLANSKYISKSRYDNISQYLSDSPLHLESYDNINFNLNILAMRFAQEYSTKIGLELDNNMIKHIGFLFARDSMCVFES
jgi:glutamate--cysteine ligase catalytic subunit